MVKKTGQMPDALPVNAYCYPDGTVEFQTNSAYWSNIEYHSKKEKFADKMPLEAQEWAEKKNDKLGRSNYNSLKRTFRKLRRLISNNFQGGSKELWVTLTYRVKMRNYKQVYVDFKRFIRKIRKKYNHVEYLVVIEPQASGSYHCHVLMKSDQKLYIPNKVVEEAWGQGFTKTKRLKNSDNVSAYLMAYLTNLDLNNLSGNINDDEIKKPKMLIKGLRLKLYHNNMNIYRMSRGIKPPKKIQGRRGELKKKFGIADRQPDFYSKRDIETKEHNIRIETEFYNPKSKK